ncbi:LysR family transcriptional regulator [Sphingobium estronivorans]|uniref:LysR family transcriptional regulator n=1 Tax=Sphingobium estronivorans TaxID=1577690 RepID=UPI00123C53DD|nr:LysR family transcriptional regulator [Sphingobium estronivorans]
MTKPIIDTASTAFDLRLGWLEAFAATARHLSYERAAIDLGIEERQTKRRVEQLEGWLNRVLVLDGTPLELNNADDIWFLPIAMECLERFSASKTWPGNAPPEQVLRKSKTSNIRLLDLQTFIKLVESGNFKATAYEMGCSHDQVRENISTLQGALRKNLVRGWSVLQATTDGIKFLDTCDFILSSLFKSRAIIPEDYDPNKQKLISSANTLNIHRINLSASVSRLEKKNKPSKMDKLEIADSRKALNVLDNLPSALSSLSDADD